jgi:hypothetical protein
MLLLISGLTNYSISVIDGYKPNPNVPNSYNPNLTMDIIEKYPTKPWRWYTISRNSNITMNFIEKNLDKPWGWDDISSNSFNGMYDEIQERWSGRLLLVQARNRMR